MQTSILPAQLGKENITYSHIGKFADMRENPTATEDYFSVS